MSGSGDALRRFERRLNLRLTVKAIARRALNSTPAALQIVLGVVLSYSFAHFVLGHATPFIAVTVVISTLGFARDARPRKVIESTLGILIGIVLSELIRLVIGAGVWQLAVVLLVTLLRWRRQPRVPSSSSCHRPSAARSPEASTGWSPAWSLCYSPLSSHAIPGGSRLGTALHSRRRFPSR
jgi:hypothetical protein